MFSRNFARVLTALAVAAGLTACESDLAGPGEEAFDGPATSADLAAVEATYETDAFNSLEVLGGQFRVPGAVLAAEAANVVVADSPDLTGSVAARADQVSGRLAAAFQSAAYAPLIPAQYLGVTMVWNGTEYVIDETATGVPEDRIRFILYAVNPVTHEIAEPLTEIGYADVIDIGTETSSGVRLQVVSGDVMYVDYSVTGSGVFNAFQIEIAGMITDGENVVEFSLTHGVQATFATRDLTVDYEISIPNRDFSVVLDLDVSVVEGQGRTATLNLTVSHGRNEVVVSGTIENESGTLTVTGNGEPFATITLSPEGIEVLNGEGLPLTEEQARALRHLMSLMEDVFDVFEDLFRPVAWLFHLEI